MQPGPPPQTLNKEEELRFYQLEYEEDNDARCSWLELATMKCAQ